MFYKYRLRDAVYDKFCLYRNGSEPNPRIKKCVVKLLPKTSIDILEDEIKNNNVPGKRNWDIIRYTDKGFHSGNITFQSRKNGKHGYEYASYYIFKVGEAG